jgi:hypothetical protein
MQLLKELNKATTILRIRLLVLLTKDLLVEKQIRKIIERKLNSIRITKNQRYPQIEELIINRIHKEYEDLQLQQGTINAFKIIIKRYE